MFRLLIDADQSGLGSPTGVLHDRDDEQGNDQTDQRHGNQQDTKITIVGGNNHGLTGFISYLAGDEQPAVQVFGAKTAGAALAAQIDNKDQKNMDVGVAYFGDGTTEEGVVHESLNFAGKYNLPMLFVVENNLFSSHLRITERQPTDSVARYAEAHNLNFEIVDGNDVIAVAEATERLLDKARNGQGAGFLESVTYRWRGHVGPREDTDVGLQRSGELVFWKKRDPVRRLKDGLMSAKHLSEDQFAALNNKVAEQVNEAWQKAEAAPYPNNENLLRHVWEQPLNGDVNLPTREKQGGQ